MNKPKPQTPLTDVPDIVEKQHTSCRNSNVTTHYKQAYGVLSERYRSLELKLQEAELLIRGLETTQTFLENENKEFEHQRDEARSSYLAIQQEHISVVAERDQLIKVVDEQQNVILELKGQIIRDNDGCYPLGNGQPHSPNVQRRRVCDMACEIDKSYSLLPHVQAKKRNQDK